MITFYSQDKYEHLKARFVKDLRFLLALLYSLPSLTDLV